MIQYKSDFYKLNIKDKSYKLVYRLKKYENINDKLKIIERKTIPYEQRLKIVNLILSANYENNLTLNEHIESQWLKHCHKLTTDALNDNNSIILEILTSYLIYEPNSPDILTHKKLNDISIIESKSLDAENNSDDIEGSYENNIKTWEINRYSKSKYKKFKSRNKRQVNNWKKSSTYKLNKIYSFKQEAPSKYWNWIKEEWVQTLHSKEWDSFGVINKELPYIVKWCYVDGENKFKFNNIEFKINDSCNSYTGEMDMILCFVQDKYYFFDKNIDSIDKKYIL